ncbi:hypothetical protein K439DRAFT_1373297 [Ramaria rubella]|nr:hypothetical protein K439DRAFT_1373297 [Ramaria rubella]
MPNAVLFPNPTPKIYQALPPHCNELDEVLAFIFTGPTKPTEKELHWTPLMVHSNKVHEALTWLKCNHKDYLDLDISIHNLNSYKDNEIPVTIEYHESQYNKYAQSISIHDCEPEEGTAEGECPFVVHGITGDELPIHNTEKLMAIAMEHLKNEGRMLGVGQASQPASIYDNPQLYPQAFSWLFPYGLGGVGNMNGAVKVPDKIHLKHLMLYHDKRFQTDPDIPLVAFNH